MSRATASIYVLIDVQRIYCHKPLLDNSTFPCNCSLSLAKFLMTSTSYASCNYAKRCGVTKRLVVTMPWENAPLFISSCRVMSWKLPCRAIFLSHLGLLARPIVRFYHCHLTNIMHNAYFKAQIQINLAIIHMK